MDMLRRKAKTCIEPARRQQRSAMASQQHYIDGKWVEGNPAVMRIWDHAIWMGAAVFDGARAFEGVTPDIELHCQRTIRSAEALGLRSPLSAGEIEDLLREGIAKF